MTTKLLAMMLLAGGTMFAGGPRVSVGISIGGGPGYYGGPAYLPPPPPAPVYYAPPPPPAPGYMWVSGYYYPVGSAWRWQQGYWQRPPHGKAKWYGPRYKNNRYYRGYWR